MNTKKNLGIWMDHSIANLIAFKGLKSIKRIESDFTHDTKADVMQKSESHMQNKEQQLHGAFYKEIAAEILKYDHVLLFGPTNAKTELHNYLSKDLHFKDIKIEVVSAEKMTENEQLAHVKMHFQES